MKVSEGQCGLVYDFLFDDQSWQINRVVVRIGVPQETLRLFPLSPTTPGAIIPEDRTFMLRTGSSAILSSPPIDTNPPVSRQRRRRLSALKIVIPFLPDEFAGVPVPMAFTPALVSPGATDPTTQASTEQEANWDTHLRSMREVIGYRVQAVDGRAGILKNFIFDDNDFSVRHLIVRVRRFLLKRSVILTPAEVIGIDWELLRVNVSIDKRTLRARRSV
ncbi:MAG: PRC-barrel domain containing protein [Candidatus Zixiibacteriota bacterium]|nr:MAG: PRC-barrel domain containing protein [candidate division Zixibacteria bacterium]